MITVSGLLCGKDIVSALEGKNLGDELIIPPNCLRSEGDMFLDDMTVEELEERLNEKGLYCHHGFLNNSGVYIAYCSVFA